MFVRRIATVTICAPEASIAARVCAESLYFPVPTSSRERYARPAMTSGSSRVRPSASLGAFTRAFLTAAHRGHDLDGVAHPHGRRRVQAPGHDRAVFFDGHALALE